MRSFKDRLRHALGFEISALLLITPLGAFAFGYPIPDIGALVVVASLIATAWTYVFNLLFDHLMMRLTGDVSKTVFVRVVHAVAFEAGLLVVLMPYMAWHLDISLWEALKLDVSFAAFYIVYAFAYNWIYDLVFPVSPAQTGNT